MTAYHPSFVVGAGSLWPNVVTSKSYIDDKFTWGPGGVGRGGVSSLDNRLLVRKSIDLSLNACLVTWHWAVFFFLRVRNTTPLKLSVQKATYIILVPLWVCLKALALILTLGFWGGGRRIMHMREWKSICSLVHHNEY